MDTRGQRVNAHDGSLVRVNGTFYLFGTVYEACVQPGPVCDGRCGYVGNVFAAYASPTMANGSWELLSDNILPALKTDNTRVSYWEANVNFNRHTGLWVMVYWSGHYGFHTRFVAVATARSPAGPFVNQRPLAVAGAQTLVSDTVALWVDEDAATGQQTAYLRYNTFSVPRRHVVERLDAAWLHTTGDLGVIFAKPDFPWYDGGGMFWRGATYYAMLSFDCCFCQWGSDALVFTAPAALGPWTPQRAAALDAAPVPPANWTNEVNPCADGRKPPATVPDFHINPCSQADVQGTNFTVPAQQFGVATLPGVRLAGSADPGPLLLYFGENFRSAPDGLKAHDLQTWIPLAFDAAGRLARMAMLPSFTIEVDR